MKKDYFLSGFNFIAILQPVKTEASKPPFPFPFISLYAFIMLLLIYLLSKGESFDLSNISSYGSCFVFFFNECVKVVLVFLSLNAL